MKPVDILLVEDNPGDIRLTEEALRDSKLYINLSITRDGEEALKFLKKEGEFANSPTPDIILLDLNLPKKDGRQVLAEIKADEMLRIIPIVVLTTSTDENDILKTYGLHANCYINKPIEFDQFLEVVEKIEDFWLTIVKLPKPHKK